MDKKKEIVDGLRVHFGIANGFKYLNKTLMLMEKICIDTFELDDWLHEQVGDYEEKMGYSMKEMITKQYSKEAAEFVENNM